MLCVIGAFSNLFSERNIPYVNYRIAENLFCKCFNAKNLAREDGAYDAQLNGCGIGIKTFVLDKQHTYQKIAEFDKRATFLQEGKDAAEIILRVAEERNARILRSNKIHGLSNKADSIYHIVARQENSILLFNTPYDLMQVGSLSVKEESKNVISFSDGFKKYKYNKSKNVLLQQFIQPKPHESFSLPIKIFQDPWVVLASLAEDVSSIGNSTPTPDSVVLPLYSPQRGEVPVRSGLNQWNARGRARNPDEVYIPIPVEVRRNKKEFFPPRDEAFILHLPDNTTLQAKICQDEGKALMSNPNSALGKWLLRDILNLKVGELCTRQHLDMAGFDSIEVIKLNDSEYRLEVVHGLRYQAYYSGQDNCDDIDND